MTFSGTRIARLDCELHRPRKGITIKNWELNAINAINTVTPPV